MAYAISKRRDGGLHLKYSGTITGPELLTAQREAYGSPPAVSAEARYILSDWSEVNDVQIGTGEMREAARAIQALLKSNPGLVFIAVLNSDFVYGLGRMAQVFVGEDVARTRIFRFPAEAEDWIGQNFKPSNPSSA